MAAFGIRAPLDRPDVPEVKWTAQGSDGRAATGARGAADMSSANGRTRTPGSGRASPTTTTVRSVRRFGRDASTASSRSSSTRITSASVVVATCSRNEPR
jgi:hypothetical protein